MFKHRIVAALGFLFVLVTPSAQAFWDPPYVTPANPVQGEPVSMNILMGVCDVIIFWPNYPQITRDGNAIHLVNYGHHWDPSELCTYGTGVAVVPIGSYEPGNYTLTVDLFYYDFFSQPQTLTLGVVAFTVSGVAPPAVPVPTSGMPGLLALILLLTGFAVWMMRGRRTETMLFIATCLVPLSSHAQSTPNLTIQVLVTNAPGAPTPAQIVNYYSMTPHIGPPPLHAFVIKSPQTVQYLIPVRAAGDFLTWLNGNPNSSRAKLENIVLAKFATTADVAAALIALQSDPYVSMAVEPPPVQPSSVELLNFGIDPDTLPPGGQYGRTDLNIDAAWQLAGGYALIAQIDTGLYTARPALTQFSNPGGMYLGGNFIPAASLDIGLTGIYPNADSPNVDEERVEPVPPPCAVVPSVNAGHGTHVAGLIAANGGKRAGCPGNLQTLRDRYVESGL